MPDPPAPKKSRAFFFVRVALLLGVLVVVVLYAAQDTYRRKHRNDWDHTLEIALIVLEQGDVDAKAIARMRERLPALEKRLAQELTQRRPGAPPPFHFSFFGPVSVDFPPKLAQSTQPAERVREMWDQWREFSALDDRAEVATRAFDSRVYVTVKKPAAKEMKLVEGESEENGRIATVQIDIAEDTVDLALIVSAHELFHTLGASDKYDATGRTVIPDGLADPTARPLYPQKRAEIMARQSHGGRRQRENPRVARRARRGSDDSPGNLLDSGIALVAQRRAARGFFATVRAAGNGVWVARS